MDVVQFANVSLPIDGGDAAGFGGLLQKINSPITFQVNGSNRMLAGILYPSNIAETAHCLEP